MNEQLKNNTRGSLKKENFENLRRENKKRTKGSYKIGDLVYRRNIKLN
ncbi:hypothetical protein THOM_2968 [Trachipleistophora hominis]|uniref:Uncharacterized protein n=1 Tax=Trachipleistophora hominis TaxID=72359 RepID=L7JSU8_TRAHO|nr:hypothetical protein THOM_2968 [Trachipleistophora hominis]